MPRQALNVAVYPRARRRRVLLTAIAGLSVTATAAVAGTLLATSGAGPVLTVMSDYEPPVAQSTSGSSVSELIAVDRGQVDVVRHSDEVAIALSHTDSEIRWFDNRPVRPARSMSMLVTAYSPDEQSCGEWADGITASGYSVWTNGMKLVAADTSILPLGSLVSIPGYDSGNVVPVLDRGGAIKGNRLDVLYPTHERALQWGVQRLEVTIWEYADGKPNGFRQNHRRR